MKMAKIEEYNGGPASCPSELQTTEIEESSGKVFVIIKKTGTGIAPPQYLQWKTYSPVGTSAPFGSLPGFRTSQGIIAPPRESVGGYVLEGREWILHATTSSYY